MPKTDTDASHRIDVDTRFMQQYLPGSVIGRTHARLHMVPSLTGQVIAFALGEDGTLSMYLSASDAWTRWTPVLLKTIGGRAVHRVLDIDVKDNVNEGRLDRTLDLALVVDVGVAFQPEIQVFYLPGMVPSGDPEQWQLCFGEARPFMPPNPLQYPNRVMLGLLPLPRRSLFVADVSASITARTWAVARYVFTPDGGMVSVGSFNPPTNPLLMGTMPLGVSVSRRAPGAPFEDALVCGCDEIVNHLCLPDTGEQPQQNLPFRMKVQSEGCTGFQTVLGAGADPAGAVICSSSGSPVAACNEAIPVTHILASASATNDGLWTQLDQNRWAARPGGIQVMQIPELDNVWHRFELYADRGNLSNAMLVHTLTPAIGHTADAVKTTFIAANVGTFCACRCLTATEEGVIGVLHVLVAYGDGSLELFAQNSVSHQWSRHLVTDGDVLNGFHEVNSYTSTIRVTDDTGAPVPGSLLNIRLDAPAYGTLNGQPVHFTPLLPTVVAANARGEVVLVTPVSTLGTPDVSVDLVSAVTEDATCRFSPMTGPTDALRTYPSGASLQAAMASIGKPVSPRQADDAHAVLQKTLMAYDATLSPVACGLGADLTLLSSRLTIRLHRGQVIEVSAQAFELPRPLEGGALDNLADLFSFMWTALKSTMDEVIEVVIDITTGLSRLTLRIGECLWSAVVAVASQAAELIDWALQSTLGISLHDIARWIGSTFGWDDILKIKDALKKLAHLSSAEATRFLDVEAPGLLAETFAALRETILVPPVPDPETARVLARRTTAGQDGLVATQPGGQRSDVNWGTSQFSSYGHLASTTIKSDSADPRAFLSALLDPYGTNAEAFAQKCNAWNAQEPFTDRDFANALDDLGRLGLASGLDAVQQSLVQAVPLAGTWLSGLLPQADVALDVPVLGPLYKALTGSALTALDLSCLVSAIGIKFLGVISQQPLLSDALMVRIEHAQRLEDVWTTTESATGEANFVAVNLAAQIMSTLGRTISLGLWDAKQENPDSPVLKIAYDTNEIIGSVLSLGWGSAALHYKNDKVSDDFRLALRFRVLIDVLWLLDDTAWMTCSIQDIRRNPLPLVERTLCIADVIMSLITISGGMAALVSGLKSIPANALPANYRGLLVLGFIATCSNFGYILLNALWGVFAEGRPKPPGLISVLATMKGVRALTGVLASLFVAQALTQDKVVPGLLVE